MRGSRQTELEEVFPSHVVCKWIGNSLQVARKLAEHFGPRKPLAAITRGDATDWRLSLVSSGLADASVRKHCGFAKHFFGQAVDHELIRDNPFGKLVSASVGNEARQFFITREATDKILEAAPDATWRLIIALSRYGGLRCPSEHLGLRWGDVDWEHGRITVTSPKTAHHVNGGSRVIPLFPELRPYLDEAFEQAEEGAEYVITRYRSKNANLRTQLERIIRRAGLEPWPKPFQNLRSTRETELADEYPTHVVCRWLGNSQPVATKHYLQMTDEHFNRALEGGAESGAVAVQNPVQQPAASSRKVSQKEPQPITSSGVMQDIAMPCQTTQSAQAPRQGLEPWTKRLTAACSTN
jgi:integrase